MGILEEAFFHINLGPIPHKRFILRPKSQNASSKLNKQDPLKRGPTATSCMTNPGPFQGIEN